MVGSPIQGCQGIWHKGLSIFTNSREKLLARLRDALYEDERDTLDASIAAANELEFDLYLAGGSVRDLLLRRPSIDLDLVTEGPSAPLAERIATTTGGSLKVYGRFATTCVTLGRVRVDVARARSETYRRPGALPDVVPGPLTADLVRRDFTINAMALGLNRSNRGSLVDPTGGLADLEAGTIRVIHEGSFVDDATRILRGLRLASRLWFDVEPETRRLMTIQARHLHDIGGSRLRTELHYLLSDVRPWRSLQQAADLGVLKALVPGLTWDERRSGLARRINGIHTHDRALRLLALLASALDEEGAATFVQRFSLGTRESRIVIHSVEFISSMAEHRQASVELALRLSKLDPVVASVLPDLVLPAAEAKKLASLLDAQPQLRGNDLIALGLREGPAVGRVLAELRRAVMSGAVSTRSDELALARTLIDKQLDSKSEP